MLITNVAIVLAVLSVLTNAQTRFNPFKSYKDERIKPPHYAKKEVNRHPIDEYLSGNQLRMMKHRKSNKYHPDASYKENWSGFDKERRRLVGPLMETDGADEQPNILSPDYLRWLCFALVGCSAGWIVYLFVNRQYTTRKINVAQKDNAIELNASQV